MMIQKLAQKDISAIFYDGLLFIMSKEHIFII